MAQTPQTSSPTSSYGSVKPVAAAVQQTDFNPFMSADDKLKQAALAASSPKPVPGSDADSQSSLTALQAPPTAGGTYGYGTGLNRTTLDPNAPKIQNFPSFAEWQQALRNYQAGMAASAGAFRGPPVATPPVVVAAKPSPAPSVTKTAPLTIETTPIQEVNTKGPEPIITQTESPTETPQGPELPPSPQDPSFWDKIGKIAKDTGKGITDVLGTALAGYNAGLTGKTLDFNTTVQGMEKQQANQEKQQASSYLQQFKVLDAQQSFQNKQAQLDRDHDTAIQNAKTQEEKDAANKAYAQQSKENALNRENAIQQTLISAGKTQNVLPNSGTKQDPAGIR